MDYATFKIHLAALHKERVEDKDDDERKKLFRQRGVVAARVDGKFVRFEKQTQPDGGTKTISLMKLAKSLEEKAAGIAKRDGIGTGAATVKAAQENPELYSQYVARHHFEAIQGLPLEVEKRGEVDVSKYADKSGDEALDIINDRAASIAKRQKISIVKARTIVAQEDPSLYDRYRSETARVHRAQGGDHVAPFADAILAKLHHIRKAAKESLADVAAGQLRLLAEGKKATNPNLSDDAALVSLIWEGITRQDMTPPDPVRFLLSVLDDPHSAIVDAAQARKIDATQAVWSQHGLVL